MLEETGEVEAWEGKSRSPRPDGLIREPDRMLFLVVRTRQVLGCLQGALPPLSRAYEDVTTA